MSRQAAQATLGTLVLGMAGQAAAAAAVKHRPAQAATHARKSGGAAAVHGRSVARSSGQSAGHGAASARYATTHGHGALHGSGHGYGHGAGHTSSHSHAGYGTGVRTSYRATVNPESRLDLIANLAGTLAHGASAIRYPRALTNFYAALAANADEPGALPVRVLQFGDSHTAADMFTGEARRVFQGQFGNGSVGFTYAGHPFAGYRILGSSRSQSSGWLTLGTHFTALGDAMTGLGGVAIETYRPGESVTEDAPCTSFEVQYVRQAGGGALQVTDNGAVVGNIDTSAPVTGAGSWHYDCPAASGYSYLPHHFVVTTLSNAPVRLLGTVALQPGVTWESMGINGAEAPLMLKWEPTLFNTYLRDTAAALVVLAYGTNEAAASWTYEGYSEVFARLIDRIHTALPNASILVLGPTDRSTAGHHRGYAPFAGTARILEAQSDVCRTHDCAFWNAQERMGGFGSMQSWVLAGWAQPDHTHFTGEGYRTLADALLADLLAGYDSYRAANGLPARPVRTTGTDYGPPGATASPSYAPPSQPVYVPQQANPAPQQTYPASRPGYPAPQPGYPQRQPGYNPAPQPSTTLPGYVPPSRPAGGAPTGLPPTAPTQAQPQ